MKPARPIRCRQAMPQSAEVLEGPRRRGPSAGRLNSAGADGRGGCPLMRPVLVYVLGYRCLQVRW
jgi:hypothetical protein